MTFPQKFQLYQFQQTDTQYGGGKKGVASSKDDEMNFIAKLEYQALENAARKQHVAVLSEMKEFWLGIRNSKSKEELYFQVERIGALTATAKKGYETLISTLNLFLLELNFRTIPELGKRHEVKCPFHRCCSCRP
jgi:hypothetical protein